jgi:histidinol dehydrogenase
MPRRLDASAAGFEAAFAALIMGKRELEEDVDNTVAAIIARVREEGDAALIELTQKFDRFALTPATMRIGAAEIDEAAGRADKAAVEALKLAAERIAAFHRGQLPEDRDYSDGQGVRLGARWTPVESVGIYVPGGTAAYPSSVLMNAVPAKVAGVERLVMTVPTPGGALNPLVMAAARIAGTDEIYRLGGAQAVAALAYGTESVAPVAKIIGPGNAYVAAAKRRVFGIVGIDMIAGPSEILVVADGTNDPAWIAADLLSQAEHDTSSQSILITDDGAFGGAVADAAEAHLATLPRAQIARASWETHGAIITVPRLDDAAALVDRIAPEHLELAVDDPDALLGQIRNAGSIFLGRHTPEAIGDYVAGPNHVLPTARSARFASGLGVLDFMKRSTFVGCTPEGLAAIGPAAVTLAKAEGFDAHALSVALRLRRGNEGG